MAVNIGFLHGEPQILEVRGGLVFINDTPQPIKYLTEEQVEDFRQVLDALPPEDAPGASALRAAKRIEFVLGLLKHTFGDDCSEYLEHLIGHLHHEVTAYLAEDE
ncbi:MAG: hypothetical protein J5863_08980 [Desulfovibrio sp.]|nr:hypothetical protein [Desulfovibrio sp.]